MKKQNDDITIKGLLEIFLPKLWIAILVAVVAALVLGAYSFIFTKDTYTSKGEYMVYKVNFSDPEQMTGLTTSEVAAIQVMISNGSQIINTDKFANDVLANLGGGVNLSPAQIKSMMHVSLSDEDTTCYFFSVTSGDPVLSKRVAEVAGDLLIEKMVNELKYAIRVVRIEDPNVPTSPNSKNVVRNAVIGVAAGFVVSLLVIFVSAKLDVVIRSREKIEDNFDIPILGVIPRLELNDLAEGKTSNVQRKERS